MTLMDMLYCYIFEPINIVTDTMYSSSCWLLMELVGMLAGAGLAWFLFICQDWMFSKAVDGEILAIMPWGRA